MHEFLEINNNWFFEKYFKNLDKRFWTFKIALNLFLQRGGEIILETGTQRLKDDWGGGCSTTIFGDFCKKYGKRLITVDINPDNLTVSRRETNEFKNFITYELSDSLDYLEKYDGNIDLLYLDSLDCKEDPADMNIEAQGHALLELKYAWDKLSKNSIILLDDNLFSNGGKTRLCKNFLQNHNWKNVMDYKQSLWIKN